MVERIRTCVTRPARIASSTDRGSPRRSRPRDPRSRARTPGRSPRPPEELHGTPTERGKRRADRRPNGRRHRCTTRQLPPPLLRRRDGERPDHLADEKRVAVGRSVELRRDGFADARPPRLASSLTSPSDSPRSSRWRISRDRSASSSSAPSPCEARRHDKRRRRGLAPRGDSARGSAREAAKAGRPSGDRRRRAATDGDERRSAGTTSSRQRGARALPRDRRSMRGSRLRERPRISGTSWATIAAASPRLLARQGVRVAVGDVHRSACTHGQNGGAPSPSQQRPQRTRAPPPAAASPASSSTSRVLPTPGSPRRAQADLPPTAGRAPCVPLVPLADEHVRRRRLCSPGTASGRFHGGFCRP